jgi:hypothetical protein
MLDSRLAGCDYGDSRTATSILGNDTYFFTGVNGKFFDNASCPERITEKLNDTTSYHERIAS